MRNIIKLLQINILQFSLSSVLTPLMLIRIIKKYDFRNCKFIKKNMQLAIQTYHSQLSDKENAIYNFLCNKLCVGLEEVTAKIHLVVSEICVERFFEGIFLKSKICVYVREE